MNSFLTMDYLITHDVSIPSRMEDYDYDGSRPNRRFISAYVHTISFKDRIMNTDIFTITFTSDVCAEIISAFYNLYLNNKNITCISIENIFVVSNKINKSSIMTISKLDNIYYIGISYNSNTISIRLYDIEISNFIELLENNILDDMYVMYSDKY